MATYTPAVLITAKVMGNGSGNITTWQYQNTGGAGTFGIARQLWFAPTAAAAAVTVEQGATGTATAAQVIVPAQVIPQNVATTFPAQITIPNNGFLQGFANNASTVGAAYGSTSV